MTALHRWSRHSFVACCLAGALARGSIAAAHGPHPAAPAGDPAQVEAGDSAATTSLQLLGWILKHWPVPDQESIIALAHDEHRAVHSQLPAEQWQRLPRRRAALWQRFAQQMQVIELDVDGASLTVTRPRRVQATMEMETPLIARVRNPTDQDQSVALEVALGIRRQVSKAAPEVMVPAGRTLHVPLMTPMARGWKTPPRELRLSLKVDALSHKTAVSLPVELLQPARIRVRTVRRSEPPSRSARLMVIGSDGLCRHARHDTLARNLADLIEKPIIYPPIGLWRTHPFFYSAGEVEMAVPPGPVRVVAEGGFEQTRVAETLTCEAGEVQKVTLTPEPLVDLAERGWVSGDTHVHGVTNQWNVDLPLETLRVVQQAEGLRVINNLTLLQRRANEAFIKPSQAPMGPIAELSDEHYHVQMGEEYRNEDLYGHLCFLNLQWLVQPIGTGRIIAGPDALDYPLNRTAIEACREQGGLSIEAHGTAGNKDVPVNVVHRLTDSLDQIEPADYYRLLDCGFRLPLSNGSDFPARPLGIARVFVQLDGPFSYARWIEALRRGRSFTSSGPLLFLTVDRRGLGEVIDAGPEKMLDIHLQAIARDPLGVVQIVSNGEILAERQTDQTEIELSLRVPAVESRWIIARCSNRDDGDATIGWGNFNTIVGPGIAHTSPVYVHVDGRPRFVPAAAQYWIDQMRQHQRKIAATGRFANATQRREATDYVAQGIAMFDDLARQITSAREPRETRSQQNARLANLLRRFRKSPARDRALESIAEADTRFEVDLALQPLMLLGVTINPEARVKLDGRRPRIALHRGRPERYCIKVENTAGVTAPLNLTAIDLATAPPGPADWCEVRLVDSPFTSRFLTGAEFEYKVVEIVVHQPGTREIRLVGDAGQGTQDLGFRATTDLILETAARRWAQSAEE
jgi:hypothetical protein